MFKWACLGVAGLFLSGLTWMVNDIRLHLRRSAETVQTAGSSINEHLPAIVDRSRETTTVVAKNLPAVVERVNRTTEVVAELAEDIRQLKELAGATSNLRDRNLVAYADGLLTAIEKSGGTIGLKKTVGGGLKNATPAREWVAAARKEALFLTLLVRSRKEMASRLCKNKFGFHWWIQSPGGDPVTLLSWVEKHYPESKTP